MSESQPIQRILAEAKEKEKKYDWLGAAELHKKVLDRVHKREDFLKAGDFQERVGYCFYRAAFQAESQEEFKEGMQRAVEAYEKARGLYDKLAGDQRAARIFRCDAMIAYMSYWLVSDAPEKKRLLGESWTLTREALKAFKDAGDAIEYRETYNELSSSAFLAYVFEWDFQAGKKIISEAMEFGEQAITLLSTVGDSNVLARAYVKAAFYVTAFGLYFIPDLDERERHFQKGQDYWQKACELSEEAALLELSSTPSSSGDEFGWNTDEIIVHFEKALGHARKTKDKYMIGTALDWLTYASCWQALAIDDPKKRAEALQRAFQYAEDAKQHFSSISFVSPRDDMASTGDPQSWYYLILSEWETNQKKKRDLLEKAMSGTQALEQAESTGYPRIICYVYHGLSAILESLARVEPNLEEKRRLLEKALEHRKDCVQLGEQYNRFEYWNLGLQRLILALLKAELSRIEKDSEKRKNMLQEAIANTKHSLRLMIKQILYDEKRGTLALFAILGFAQYSYGELLIRLYGLTNSTEHYRKAIKAFEEAAESYQKVNMLSRVAECHWKIAGSCDALGDHLKAAENFTLASTNYVSAAENIRQLESFYRDYAVYMEAWTEIEKARHSHRRQEYGKAKEHYEKSASLHRSTERWSYINNNYLAWARLEEAEDLSRREQTEEARDFFQKASDLFVEAKKSIQARLEETETEEEKELLVNLAKASEIRCDYCLGRAVLEEAKILDRMGDHMESSRKYGSASEKFQKVSDALERESDRLEVRPIVDLCRAWEMMARAEAEASPELYLEASKHFEEAKDHSLDEKSRIMALGHSSFCKALEAGARFEATRDTTLHSPARKHLEAAANYYRKAGFKTASDYTKATYRLFDAYVYTDKAQAEIEPTKKAQYYRMAEKLLQASVDSYTKAKHPEKGEEVYRLLESVKEERQLAMSLAEVLAAPTIASTTTSFSTPNPTHEKAVGLERFEHADIQVNLTASEGMTVDEELEVRLDLANVGKESGLLVRIDDLIPSGFKAVAPPSQYRIDDGSIDMKGKKLDPLKVETIKLNLRATKPGSMDLNPKVVYVDDAGNFRTCKAKPVTVTVHPKLALEFKTRGAENVFNYLVSSFVEDYMRRRLNVQEAGWRSLVQVIKNAEVSSRSVYGSRGSHGSAISELERRGLVETRIFLGERGRGGRIVKARISYEKETVKRIVDQKVAKKE